MPKRNEKEKDAKERVVTVKEDRLLPVPLTEKELLAFSAQLADAHQAIVELENQLTSFKEENKGKMALHEASISRLSNLIRQKYEHRYVPVVIEKNWKTETLRVLRQDDMRVVEERKMTSGELSELPMGEDDNG
jgi:hypothetical protein